MKRFFAFTLLFILTSGNFLIFGQDLQNDMNSDKKMSNQYKKALFAGGCFWCMESPYEDHPGVIEAVAGYTGGKKEDSTYDKVCSGKTAHLEAVLITYDPYEISYDKLLEIFWRQIDPTDSGGQFADRGAQYKTAVFYFDEGQKKIAEASKEKLEASGYFDKPIVTKILEASVFYAAEEYHQDYYKKNPERYKLYRRGSGRESFLEDAWGGSSK